MDAMSRKGRKRMRTVAFRVDEEAFARIDVLSGLSGLSKQDYMEARMLMRASSFSRARGW